MWHVGIHIWQVPVNEIEPDYDEYYAVVMAFNLLNIPILPLVKASIILLLLRAGSVIEWLKRALYAILIFTVGSALIPWFLYIFICPPLTGNTWAPRTFGGLHCMGRHKMGEMLIWVTCANLFTDVLILPIPFIIVRRMMSARLRSRLVVLAVFTCSLAVTAIGAAKIYLSYRDRLYTLFNPDWTYPIDYCINHIENNVAIIVANIPILRGLVTRWIFNFRTKATPLECRGVDNGNGNGNGNQENWQQQQRQQRQGQWDSSHCSSDMGSRSSQSMRKSRTARVIQKILPCVHDDFSSSLATRSDQGKTDTNVVVVEQHQQRPKRPDFPSPPLPPRCLAAPSICQKRSYSYFSRSPRRHHSPDDRFQAAGSCEKGGVDMTETVRSVGSLGSAPTLVESKDVAGWDGSGKRWKSMELELESPPVSPNARRESAATLHAGVAPLTAARLRGESIDEDEVECGRDGIYPFSRL
ncbi:hypothetical protein DDE82_004597 [Stemphylium lycopersici]|uniref:Rhodopsin domain-containing protein n=1 Tax=Stemphylium lycopersici TaxID=183478 RepID=A0A364N390_STELY|nr:hypothetical protein TW65_02943 [Stemphylium lycopersici]RAR04392.1 hypothetical protein DDE82_004597 [Stemphylium lycopersici]RAR10773.1 hypothetical protein DDE83_004917 [Stemphylium lycopersici]